MSEHVVVLKKERIKKGQVFTHVGMLILLPVLVHGLFHTLMAVNRDKHL